MIHLVSVASMVHAVQDCSTMSEVHVVNLTFFFSLELL